jgi:hypothetical protein
MGGIHRTGGTAEVAEDFVAHGPRGFTGERLEEGKGRVPQSTWPTATAAMAEKTVMLRAVMGL